MKKVKIAILGMGTVGGGTYDILTKNRDIIMKRVGIDYEISAILERRMEVIDAHGADHALVTQDIDSILDGDTDIIVECLGGIDFPVSIMKRALENGIGVVTPNKAAVAANYDLLRGGG